MENQQENYCNYKDQIKNYGMKAKYLQLTAHVHQNFNKHILERQCQLIESENNAYRPLCLNNTLLKGFIAHTQ